MEPNRATHLALSRIYFTASQYFAECLKTLERVGNIGSKWVYKELIFMSPFALSLLTKKVRSKLFSCQLATCQEM